MVWRRGDPPWAPPELWGFGKVFGIAVLLIPVLLIGLWFSAIVRTGCSGSLTGDAPTGLASSVEVAAEAGTAPAVANEAGWCLDGATSWWTPGLAVVGAVLVGGWLPTWIVRSGVAASTTFAARIGLLGLGATTGATGVVSLAWLLIGTVDRAVPG